MEAVVSIFFASIASSTSNVHNVEIENVNLHGRKILQELSVNPRLAGIKIINFKMEVVVFFFFANIAKKDK